MIKLALNILSILSSVFRLHGQERSFSFSGKNAFRKQTEYSGEQRLFSSSRDQDMRCANLSENQRIKYLPAGGDSPNMRTVYINNLIDYPGRINSYNEALVKLIRKI